MRVILAESAGFCYGVHRAVDLARKAAEERGQCWMLGDLIHNAHVVEELRSAGIGKTEDPAALRHGDTVIIRPQETAENGQIVVALLDDSATVKRLRRDETGVWLLPENPAYPPIDGREAAILGVVVALQREY